ACLWTRQRKSCPASSSVGTLNEATAQPCGLTDCITCEIVPSLPLVSIPCRTMSKLCCLAAYSHYCKLDSSACSPPISPMHVSLSALPVSDGSKSLRSTLVGESSLK